MKQPLHIVAEDVPTEGAEQAWRNAIALLADGLAELAIADARAELAAALGLAPETLDHERGGLTAEARAAADVPLRPRSAR